VTVTNAAQRRVHRITPRWASAEHRQSRRFQIGAGAVEPQASRANEMGRQRMPAEPRPARAAGFYHRYGAPPLGTLRGSIEPR
jgi:hypothetical protein